MEIDRALVSRIAERVLRELEGADVTAPGARLGCFTDVSSAIEATEKAFQSYRSTGMNFVGRNADFRAKAIFKAIGKTR